ncbi:HlyD family secretion protein [Sphingomonas qomolangmaensis]|uniref:HlyD family secretion protein n=1 Tax=Sphingomonas qomolangmaensis TaxID=2918765 RepID=A0ABY5LB77_9SPHN|nr:HlyD family efflux transporter periplasmic adaptor subunit [Sphingomonas qomolangmaensis]UUL84027.1 HlyD family secretion protein [Sphingomonas qomolangmaensis]
MPVEPGGQSGNTVVARRRIPRRAPEANEVGLFRAEALRRRHEISQPRPLAIAPPAWSAVSLLLLTGFAVVALFLFFGSFARKETVAGALRPVEGAVLSTTDRSGIIAKIHVRENQLVRAGDPLYDVRTESTLLDGRTLANESMAVLEAQDGIARLEAGARVAQTMAELASVQQRAKAGEASIQGLRVRHALAARRRINAEKQVEAARPLVEKGFLSRQELYRREDAALFAGLEEAQLASELVQTEEARAGYQLDAQRLRARASGEEAQSEMAATQLRERQLSAAQDRGFRVRAAVSGRVSGLRLTVGMRADPGQPVLTLLPENVPLVADLYIPSRAVGFVLAGQPARLMYEAYPFQKFGVGQGTVVSVSRGPVTPADPVFAESEKEPVYLVRVALAQQTIDAFGERHPLRPGMMLKADLILEKRSIFEWMIDPVLSSSRRLQ